MAPTSIATLTISSRCSGFGRLTGTADRSRQQRREPVLAVDADVEQVHPEADSDGDGGKVVERGGVEDQHLSTRLAGVLDHLGEGQHRAEPAGAQRQAGHH
jgi:hypothetical protein